MTDKQLINHICDEWLEYGGDAEGFSYTWGKILDELKARERASDERTTRDEV